MVRRTRGRTGAGGSEAAQGRCPRRTYLILISYRAADPQLAADVSNAVAQSFLEHTFNIAIGHRRTPSFMEKQMEGCTPGGKVERGPRAF